MAITLSQLIDHHDRELKDAVEKTKDKPQSNIEQMIWNFHYTRLEFHAQALALLRSIRPGLGHRIPFTREDADKFHQMTREQVEHITLRRRVVHAESCACPGCVYNRKGNQNETQT